MGEQPTLKRDLGLVSLTLYGVGVIVGAGIYVLVGRVAGLVGNAVWAAFVGAALAALPTGLCYAELASRYPRSAGEAVFADRAFGRPALSFLVGYMVLASGVTSTATLAHGFANYFADLTGLSGSKAAIILGFLMVLSVLNHRGIREAAWVNAVCTIASVSALLVLIAAGYRTWGAVDVLRAAPPGDATVAPAAALLAGVALAFYAFIGFEDICNVAEEVKQPQRTIPRAILLSLAISALLYLGVGVTVVSVVPAAELAVSEVPLRAVSERLLPGFPKGWLSVVALFAVTNSALFNLIMCSRIFYGMADNGWIPRLFAGIHGRRRTPTWGVAGAFALALALALTGVLGVLAEATNTIILAVFSCVNLSLLVVKLRGIEADEIGRSHFAVPIWVPIVGLALTVWLAAQFSPGAYGRAAALLALGAVLYGIQILVRRRAES